MKCREKFEKCYQKYKKDIEKYIRKHINSPYLSEEFTQDVFLKVFEKGYELDPDSVVTLPFLYRIGKHSLIDHYRKESRRKIIYNTENIDETVIDDDFYNDLENSYIHGEVVSTLNDVLSTFGDMEQKVFIDRVFLEKSVKEIREELSMSYYEVNKILKKIKQKMRDDLKEYFDED